ncbi:MAG TPA: phage major capsid protein [Actinomycetes bacterium]|nr:phage major capsid protein [Actinomycetes bacterium]
MTDEIRPPREDLYRAMTGGASSDDGRTLTVRLAPHEEWATIHSVTEGHFVERFARSAYRKTMAEAKPKILFNHGKDPEIGEKIIATTDETGEDETSPYARGQILDGLPELVRSGLRAGAYGASHRFSVVRESWNDTPKGGPHNPDKLPERTITEAKLYELGPVTWPAYASASASLRSLTDEMRGVPPPEPVAPSDDAAAEEPHLVPERRDEPEPIAAPKPEEIADVADINPYTTRDEKAARVVEIERELETIDTQFDGKLSAEAQARWDGYLAEKDTLIEAIEAVDARKRILSSRAIPTDPAATGFAPSVNVIKQRDTTSIYDVQRTRRESRDENHFSQTLRDNAMRSVEGARFPATDQARGQAEVESLLNGIDNVEPTEAAKRVLYTGSPAYRRAFRKYLTQGAAGPMLTPEEGAAYEETRAALVTLANTAVPFDLDPTMANNTSGAINPYRQAFRVVKTTSNDWRPQVSSGITAAYAAEAAAATEQAPGFTAPASLLQKAHTAATFSVELQGDFPGLEAELAKEIADAKDVLEATKFGLGAGSGSDEPMGLFIYYTDNFLDTTTTLVIVPEDLYKLERNIGPRHRGNTVWIGSPYFYSLVRGIDTAGGAGIWVDNLRLPSYGSMDNNGLLGTLLGHPAYEGIAPVNTAMATTNKVAILADRDRFVIIDRIGMNLELIPNFLDAATGYPTGQRMVYAWWRNYSTGIGLATIGAGRSSCIFRGK